MSKSFEYFRRSACAPAISVIAYFGVAASGALLVEIWEVLQIGPPLAPGSYVCVEVSDTSHGGAVLVQHRRSRLDV